MPYLLDYQLSDDYLERRPAFRVEHLALARTAVVRGELVLGGALAEPVDRALLLFQGPSPAAAEAFANADPYVKNGLIRSWRVRPWTTVVGAEAATLFPDEALPAELSLATRPALVAFLRGARHGVVASIGEKGEPQAATVGLAVTDDLELVFDTLDGTRKASNLRRKAEVAVVVTRGSATVQIDGVADEPQGDELERVRSTYLDAFPDGRERATWKGITYFRVRPTWIRMTDFGVDPPRIVESTLGV